jgi:hypothetical protein
MEISRKGVAEMLGEAFREIAVLLVVFAPLDRWVEKRPYSWSDFWQTVGLGAIVFVVGAAIERTRRT